MESLYHKTKQLINQLHDKLKNLEIAATEDEIRNVSNQMTTGINEIITNFDKLDIFVNKEPATRRADAKLRVDELKYDLKHIQTAFRNIQYRKEQKMLEEKRREELLRNSYTYNSNQNRTDTSLMLDHEQQELRHHNRLANANTRLDELIDHGENVLGNVRSQKVMLKSVKTRILNIGNTLGLSSTIMNLIQRRSATDRRIMYGLMILTCFIMFLTVKYFVWK